MTKIRARCFLWLNLLLVTPVALRSFINTIEYPNLDFETKRATKVAISAAGELFVGQVNAQGSLEWLDDFGTLPALGYWSRIIENRLNARQLLDLVLRNVGLHYLHGSVPESALRITAEVIRNLCCCAEMLAWKKVFFCGPLAQRPVFYEHPLYMVQQRIQVQLCSAREYIKFAEFICPAAFRQVQHPLGYERLLTTKGCLFLIQQAAQFYLRYVALIGEKTAAFSASPNARALFRPISCNKFDWSNLSIILFYADNICLSAADRETLQHVKLSIETQLGGGGEVLAMLAEGLRDTEPTVFRNDLALRHKDNSLFDLLLQRLIELMLFKGPIE